MSYASQQKAFTFLGGNMLDTNTNTTTGYTFSRNIKDYMIFFNGWSGNHNIQEIRDADRHEDFVLWLTDEVLNNPNTDIEYDIDQDAYEDQDGRWLSITFYGQEVVDQASFPIYHYEDMEEARGFDLLVRLSSITPSVRDQ